MILLIQIISCSLNKITLKHISKDLYFEQKGAKQRSFKCTLQQIQTRFVFMPQKLQRRCVAVG